MRVRSIRIVRRLEGRRVLIREDYNVPLSHGKVVDATRIVRSLPTIKFLLTRKAVPVLLSHWGRPGGRRDIHASLEPVARELGRLLRRKVLFFSDCVGPAIEAHLHRIRPYTVVLLENTRFHSGEEANDKEFARSLSHLGELFVMDAFGSAHRANASTEGITHFLSSYAGFLIQDELDALSVLRVSPPRPYVAVIGGAKLSTKVGLIQELLKVADHVLLGGELANAILRVQGIGIGRSRAADEDGGVAAQVRRSMLKSSKLRVPVDVLVGDTAGRGVRARALGLVRRDEVIWDIGPATVKLFQDILAEARTIAWNGPMGWIERKEFAHGTDGIMEGILASDATHVVVGGGETLEAVSVYAERHEISLAKHFPHIFLSTGGGAMIEFLEGRELPGLKALITDK